MRPSVGPAARLLPLSVVVVLVLAVVGLGASPASAGSAHRVDPRGDTWKKVPGGEWEEAVARPNVDVREVGFTHGHTTMSARLGFGDLRRNGDYVQDAWLLDVGQGQFFQVVLTARKGHYAGRLKVIDSVAHETVRCGDKQWKIDYRRNVVRWSVSRECLATPRHVRFAGLAQVFPSGKPGVGAVRVDAMHTKNQGDAYSRWLDRG